MTCNDKDCQHKLERCLDGIKKHYLKKPPTWLSSIIVLTFISITITTVGTGYKLIFGQEIAPYKYAPKADCDLNTRKVEVLQESVKRMDKNIIELKENVKEDRVEANKKFDEIKDILKDLKQDIRRNGR